jgi:hypothetical protein
VMRARPGLREGRLGSRFLAGLKLDKNANISGGGSQNCKRGGEDESGSAKRSNGRNHALIECGSRISLSSAQP